MGNTKKEQELQKEPKYIWDTYLSKCVSIYMMIFMVVFILFCKEGYVAYDLHKRNLFYGIGLLFIASTILILLLSLSSNERRPWKDLFSKMDLWILGILASWGIGMVFCVDHQSAFWGDIYRYVGASYLGLGIIGMWIISRYVDWSVWLTRVFVGVGIIIFIWQILNFYYIDPFNWTFDQQYHYLMSSLANTNQNSCFDVLVLSIGMVMFLFAKETKDKVLFGLFLLLGYMGGIASSSSGYYLGIGVVFVALLAYVLRNPGYLWDMWLEVVLFIAAAVVHKIFIIIYDDELVYDPITKLMLQPVSLVVLLVLLAVSALLLWKVQYFFDKYRKVLSNGYLIVVAVIIVCLLGCFIYANISGMSAEDGGFLAKFVMNDLSGSGRWLIWRCTLGMFAQESWIQKLFGIGLNNYSTVVYQYYPEELVAVWGVDTRLADAHSVYLDMLASSGIIGTVSYFGIAIHVMISSIRRVKEHPVMLYAILGILGWLAISIVNSNLNVTAQVFFVMLGVFWGILRKVKRGEKVEETVGLM